MQTTLVPVTMSATVEGEITNTVKVRGPRGGRSKGRRPPAKRPSKQEQPPNPRRARKPGARINKPPRYKLIPEERGRGYKLVGVSISTDALKHIDELAARVQMSRSRFLRQAYKHYAVSLERPATKRQWKTISISMAPADIVELTGFVDTFDYSSVSKFLRDAAVFFGDKIFPRGMPR